MSFSDWDKSRARGRQAGSHRRRPTLPLETNPLHKGSAAPPSQHRHPAALTAPPAAHSWGPVPLKQLTAQLPVPAPSHSLQPSTPEHRRTGSSSRAATAHVQGPLWDGVCSGQCADGHVGIVIHDHAKDKSKPERSLKHVPHHLFQLPPALQQQPLQPEPQPQQEQGRESGAGKGGWGWRQQLLGASRNELPLRPHHSQQEQQATQQQQQASQQQQPTWRPSLQQHPPPHQLTQQQLQQAQLPSGQLQLQQVGQPRPEQQGSRPSRTQAPPAQPGVEQQHVPPLAPASTMTDKLTDLPSRLLQQYQRELWATGEQIHKAVRPAAMGKHWPFCTVALFLATMFVFFFMCGSSPYHTTHARLLACTEGSNNPAVLEDCIWQALATNASSPSQLGHWLVPSLGSSADGDSLQFSFAFMREWGSRYAPDIQAGQHWRWLSSAFVHVSFAHVASNMALLLILGWSGEVRHGWWVLLPVWLAGVLGGGLMSAAAEDPCVQVVGASGGVFGLLALHMADLAVFRGALGRPALRCTLLAALVLFFLVSALTVKDAISHVSHVGGFLMGLFVSLALLRNRQQERPAAKWKLAIERAVPWVAAGLFVIFAVALPAWVYTRTLQDKRLAECVA